MANVRSEFRIGLKDETRAGVQSINRSLDELNKSATRAAAGLATIGVGVLAGLGASAAQVVNLGDKLRDMSFATGQSVEQLSFLDFAAKQSGTSIETIASASQRLAKNLTDVSRGGGKAAAVALQELGLSAEQLSRLDLVGQIETIGQALQKIENPSQRAAAGAALFGKQFKELAPLVLDTANSFSELADEFVRMGGTLTKEQADQFDALNDSIGKLQLSVRSAGEALATVMAPSLTAAASAVAEFIQGIGPALTSKFFDLKVVLLDASRAVQRSKLDFIEFFNVFGVADSTVGATKERIAEITREIELARDAQQGVIDDAIAQQSRARDSLGQKISGGLDTENTTIEKERTKAAKDLARAEQERFRVYSAAVDETLSQIEAEAREWEELDRRRQAALDANRTPLQRELDSLKELNELLGSDSAAYGEAAVNAFNRATAGLEETDDKAKALDVTFASLGATFSSAFEDAILNGEKFSDVLGGLAKDIARLLLKETVSDPLAGLFKGFAKSAGSGIGDFFSGLFGGARANGGPVSAGKAYLVGERGPELFAPGVSGNIIPNGGGGLTVVNIGAAPTKTRERVVNGRRVLYQTFTDAATGATAEGMLSSLGIAPPLVAR